ncbi:M20 family metallo-hydrolase [Dethiosulfovibrio sp. F2B]|uniref:M20 family metallo-hydrolase n=1 Tax=Dethiosulfovibrio faecalis TaxID=2720018 RepID=UPI001F2572F2|nr:M20 family metallo-hydrolase [Dethiosulfovibrio faecalis]MCF4152302.1 M20 family metallo-hydrolase [Dethiosulfovibrio faecalis]
MKDRAVNRVRLRDSIETLGRVGLDDSGFRTRLALDDGDKAGRDLLVSWLEASGLEVKVDAIGNIFGILPGEEQGDPVMLGSHIDTVRHAGRFDGCVGVLGGLEVLRTVAERGISHRRSLAVAAFTNEEGARFAPDMMGSLVLAEEVSVEDMYSRVDDDGVSVGEELERIGYRGSDLVRPSAYLEIHVEQGPYLDMKGVPFGVVDGVQGIVWWQGRYVGQANHAGTTPMGMRNDSLLAVSHLHVKMTELAESMGGCATIGKISVDPYIINVIPGETGFTLDLRHPDGEKLASMKEEAERTMDDLAERFGLEVRYSREADVAPVSFDEDLVSMIQSVADERGLSSTHLWSGAGHDAQIMSHIVPTAMIFVPSIGGKSHCPQEDSDFDQIADGVDVLLECAVRLANR